MLRLLPLALLFVSVAFVPPLAQAQDAPANPITQSLKGLYDMTSANIMQTAEMADADLLAYRPTDDVRSTGELLAHIANAQFAFCSAAAGEESPNEENFEETATTKDELIAALESGIAYCNGVYASMTDEAASAIKPVFGMQMAGAAILSFNTTHNYEHYGNLVTYLRMNDLVPPSSQQ